MIDRLWLSIFILTLLTVASVGIASPQPDSSATDEPLAEAGLDQEVPVNSTVYLDAGGSLAREGSLERYEWQIERPDGTETTPVCPHCEETTFEPTQTGVYNVTVTVTDDAGRDASDTLLLTVFEYDLPELSLSGPDVVEQGELASVDLVANAGEEPLSGLAWFRNGVQEEAVFVDGQQATDSFQPPVHEPGYQTIEASVTDTNGYSASASHELFVRDPDSAFSIQITETNSPVDVGEELTAAVRVENIDDEVRTQDIVLENTRGVPVDHVQSLTLAPGETERIDVGWRTQPADAGTGEITARSATHADSATVEIRDEGSVETEFRVQSVDADPIFFRGETGTVTAEIMNWGAASATQTVVLTNVEGTVVDSTTVQLDDTAGWGFDSETVTFEWTPSPDTVYPDGDMTVYTYDDSGSDATTVRNTQLQGIAIHDAPAVMEVGSWNSVTVYAELTDGTVQEITEPATLQASVENSFIEFGVSDSGRLQSDASNNFFADGEGEIDARYKQYRDSVTVELVADADGQDADGDSRQGCVYHHTEADHELSSTIEVGHFEHFNDITIHSQGSSWTQSEWILEPDDHPYSDGCEPDSMAGESTGTIDLTVHETSGTLTGVSAPDDARPGNTHVQIADSEVSIDLTHVQVVRDDDDDDDDDDGGGVPVS